jgi:hypothetical protein
MRAFVVLCVLGLVAGQRSKYQQSDFEIKSLPGWNGVTASLFSFFAPLTLHAQARCRRASSRG